MKSATSQVDRFLMNNELLERDSEDDRPDSPEKSRSLPILVALVTALMESRAPLIAKAIEDWDEADRREIERLSVKVSLKVNELIESQNGSSPERRIIRGSATLLHRRSKRSGQEQVKKARPPQVRLLLISILAGVLLSSLDQSIVVTALPNIVSDIGGLDKQSWLVTTYVLAATVVSPLWGKLCDAYEPRLVFRVAISMFIGGSLLAGLSQSIGQLIFFRGLQGAGGGGLLTIALIIVGKALPPGERARYGGFFGAIFGVAGAAGPIIGGLLAGSPLGWRWIFYINVPIGVVSLALTYFSGQMPVERKPLRIDYLGAATTVIGVASLLLYIDWRSVDYGWTDPLGLLLLAIFLAMIPVFVMVERRAAEPIFPIRLFRNPTFTLGCIFSFLMNGVSIGVASNLPTYLQSVLGVSPAASGVAVFPLAVGIFIMSLVSGRMISRTGKYRKVTIIGAAAVFAALALLAIAPGDASLVKVMVCEALLGIGVGMTFQPVTTAIQNSVEPGDLAAATSSSLFARQIGAAVCTAALGAVFSSRLVHYLSQLPTNSGGAVAAPQNIEIIQQLPEPVRSLTWQAFGSAFGDLFSASVPLILVALVTAFFLKELPMQTKQTGSGKHRRPRASRLKPTSASAARQTASHADAYLPDSEQKART